MSGADVSVVVAFHSGYGHTKKIAEAVQTGADKLDGVSAHLLDVTELDEAGWESLNRAHVIVFGSPTYMGGASGPFKVFADASSKIWFTQGWKNKIAGGFTCSGAMSGDKSSTLTYFMTLAMQHGMVWVGTALMPSDDPGDPDTVNRLGSYMGVMAQADNVPPEQSPPEGDIETAVLYGERLARAALGQLR
ncbi:MAG: flavodoxin family protein [Burkholderiaceae bacterium]